MSATPPGCWFDSSAGEPPGRWRRHRRRRPEQQVVAAVERRAPYNLWMTTPQTAATRPAALPADLTVDEAVRIADAITAAHADSTRTVYAWAWSQWERWCAGRGATAMPAEPAMICAYLTERAAAGLSVGTIDLACGAISYHHRMHGLPDPILTEGVRQVRRGLRRIIGAAPRRQARPLGTDDIRTIVESIDRSTALGARDAALILLGFASAMRRSELAALTLVDVEFQPGGVLLTIRRSKTDQYADGQAVAVVHGQHAATDPIAALDAWLHHRGTEPGRVFTSMRSGSVTSQPISGEAISIVLRKRARAAGLAAERVTAHSLRAGHATTAAVAGVALDRIAAQTRHKRLSTLIERYIRPAQALEHTSSRDLGL
jgi:integrase